MNSLSVDSCPILCYLCLSKVKDACEPPICRIVPSHLIPKPYTSTVDLFLRLISDIVPELAGIPNDCEIASGFLMVRRTCVGSIREYPDALVDPEAG